jgi:hypothetical protein
VRKFLADNKATVGTDPRDAFYISKDELIEAALHGDHYYTYGLTSVDTSGTS